MNNDQTGAIETPEPTFGEDPPQARTLFGNKLYDQLKFVAQILLPALATFYGTLGALWGFPKTDEVVGSIVAFDLFLGALLLLATRQYESSGAKYDGVAFVSKVTADDGETPMTQMGISMKPSSDGATVEKQDEIVLKVVKE